MKSIPSRFTLIQFVILVALASTMLLGGCARYARTVNTFYDPSATVRSGSGNIYVIIPENQTTQSSDVKWVLGNVKNDDNKNIDNVYSSRSPAEIIQAAFSLEFQKAGYTVIPATKRTGTEERVLDLTTSKIELEQISDVMDIKAKCRVLVGVDVFKNGQLIKRLQYEATSSKTDIKDRDLLAESVLQESLKSIMKQAVPELQGILSH
ncbi:MAG: hypothetical protein PHH28_08335 [Desulfuromonadaceae bacterium]|nr:hypothetical protein [Desulfuromonadaceae bacterium]